MVRNMIYKYGELKGKGLDNYNISKKVANKELYKIEKGLYSDTEKYNHLEYIVKKYPKYYFYIGKCIFLSWINRCYT